MIKSLAIYTIHSHHGSNSGYKQILKYTKPTVTAGLKDTTRKDKFLSYYYKHEFIGWMRALLKRIQIVHILYGEDYFRFSHLLFRRLPIVVTFHQPESILLQELRDGDYNGKVAGITHRLTKSRFEKVDAVILTSENQLNVAKQFFDHDKIHVIPLGIHINKFNQLLKQSNIKRQLNLFITVGEWQRDWDLYIKHVSFLNEHFPELEFIVVNNKLSTDIKEKLLKLSNVTYKGNVSDDELYMLYLKANAMFLPLKGVAGSNALNEALALGVMILSNLKLSKDDDVFLNYESLDDLKNVVNDLLILNNAQRLVLAEKVNSSVQSISWESISKRTLDVYELALKRKNS
jgi:glycosyltransferase involved in cell wall biosynthesis